MEPNHKLTNKDIFDNYQNYEFFISQNDIVSAFSYWIIYQSNRIHFENYNLSKPLIAFHNYLHSHFPSIDKLYCKKFSFQQLEIILSKEALANIPEILNLSQTHPDFISLDALARNVFFMVLREQITYGYIQKNKSHAN